MSQIAIFTVADKTYYYDVEKAGGWPRVCMAVIVRQVQKGLLAQPHYKGQEPPRPETDDLDTLKLWIQQVEAHRKMRASYERAMKSWALIEKALQGDLGAAAQYMSTQNGWNLVGLAKVPKSIPQHIHSQEERRKALTDLLLRASQEPLVEGEIRGQVSAINKTGCYQAGDPHPYDKDMEQRIEKLTEVLLEYASVKPTLTSQERVGETLNHLGFAFDWEALYASWEESLGGLEALTHQWFEEWHGRKPERFSDHVNLDNYIKTVRARRKRARGSNPTDSA